MSNILLLVILGVASYFYGNINWALLISKLKKSDIRKMGSGNPGTLNMSRNFGLKIGLLTFFLDVSKGVLPTLIAYFILVGRGCLEGTEFQVFELGLYVCGFMAVIGHIYPIVLKFKGGKGIATTIGVLIVVESVHGISWASVLIMSLVCAVVFIYFTEFGAMGSFIAITPPAIAGSIRLYLYYGTKVGIDSILYLVCCMLIFLICFFTWFAHRKNIDRMLKGEEHPTSIKQMVIKSKAKKQQQQLEVEQKESSNKN